jgi:hypothetical protein
MSREKRVWQGCALPRIGDFQQAEPGHRVYCRMEHNLQPDTSRFIAKSAKDQRHTLHAPLIFICTLVFITTVLALLVEIGTFT